ncbi:MAG: diacylglycerol kinase family lipid kinase [Clostridia bacterium]|nr:diacylglycerol kinase family lipid kinase [Clostridia bacterium]
MKKMLLIINPKSGVKKSAQIFDTVGEIIKDNEWELDSVFTEYRGHATELASTASGYDRIVCMGGDGTFNEVINGLLPNPQKQELGYIPAGSTNDFACGLGLPKTILKNAKFAANQSAFPTDMGLFRAEGADPRHFSYVASFGLFTDISYSTDQKIKNIFGHMAYIFEGIRSIADLGKFKPFKMRIEIDDIAIESEFIFGAITNSTSLGGLMKLDKNQIKISDGQFEVILIRKPESLVELTQTITELLNNRFRTENIFFGHIDKLKIIPDEPLKWTLDGEYAGTVGVAEISVLPGIVNLVRPTAVRRKPFFRKRTV